MSRKTCRVCTDLHAACATDLCALGSGQVYDESKSTEKRSPVTPFIRAATDERKKKKSFFAFFLVRLLLRSPLITRFFPPCLMGLHLHGYEREKKKNKKRAL